MNVPGKNVHVVGKRHGYKPEEDHYRERFDETRNERGEGGQCLPTNMPPIMVVRLSIKWFLVLPRHPDSLHGNELREDKVRPKLRLKRRHHNGKLPFRRRLNFTDNAVHCPRQVK